MVGGGWRVVGLVVKVARMEAVGWQGAGGETCSSGRPASGGRWLQMEWSRASCSVPSSASVTVRITLPPCISPAEYEECSESSGTPSPHPTHHLPRPITGALQCHTHPGATCGGI